MPPERFAILVQGHLDGTLAAAERDELAVELARDAQQLDELLDQIGVAAACSPGTGQLRERLSGLLAAPDGPDVRRLAGSRRLVRRRPACSLRPWLAAAMLVLATGTLAWLAVAHASGPAAALPVLHARDGDAVLRSGRRLQPPAGQPLALMAGDGLEIAGPGARLVWPDGSSLAWESGARATIPDSPTTLAIASGSAACAWRHRADGAWRIEVPDGTVTDRGTSFTLQVRPQLTLVRVIAGEVALRSGGRPEVSVAAGADGCLGQGAASTAPQAVEAVGFARGEPFSDDGRHALFCGNGLQWGTTARIAEEDGVPTLILAPDGRLPGCPWLMRTFYERPLAWSGHRGLRVLLRGSGAVQFHLEDNQQPGGLPQQNERFESPWQEAAAAWRLVAIPFAALTRSQVIPRYVTGPLPDDGLGLDPVRGIGFRLRDAATRVELRDLALY